MSEENTQQLNNQQITNTIKQIRRLIVGSMDGVTATTMRQKGLNYRQNFGVSLPRLREIAHTVDPNLTLAEQLWQTDCRETQIVGLLLMPTDQITTDTALRLADTIPTSELAEIAAMTLFCKLADIDRFVTQLSTLTNPWRLLTACCTTTRALHRLQPQTIETVLHAVADNDIDMATANAAYTLLQHLHDQNATTSRPYIDILAHSSNALCQRIATLII
ncbi:MAG: DNA alkylation repair protein [Paludibacteraceae bacterium]